MSRVTGLPETFQWGEGFPQHSIDYVLYEIFWERVYDKYHGVEPGDVVMDIGSSMGPFSYYALKTGAKKVYCVEPSETALRLNLANNAEFIINAKDSPCVFINHAIGQVTNLEKTDRSVNLSDSTRTSTIRFNDMIKMYGIDHVDFLKMDCEGGEYDVFTEENMPFLRDHVDFMACEIHGRYGDDYVDRYDWMRKNILPHFGDYRLCCAVDGKYTDITEFVNHYDRRSDYLIRQTELMLYVSRNQMPRDDSIFILKP